MSDEAQRLFWDGLERRTASELATVTTKISTLHEDVTEVKNVLRELTTAITKLALIEERQMQFSAAQERAFNAISKLSDRVAELEKRVPEQSKVAVWVDRAIMATVGATLLFVAKKTGLL